MPKSQPEHRIEETWFRHAFGALYPVVYAHRSVAAAAPEARFAAQQLQIQPGQRVLDLCCGNGRHIVHLAALGAQITGLDYSPHLLAMARETLANDARLVRGDMRAAPFNAVFDAVTNFFTSFGYFQDPAENAAVVQSVARALKPSGRFFIDYLNADHVRATLVPHSERTQDGLHITERRWIDAQRQRVNKLLEVRQDGRVVHQSSESVKLYTRGKFKALLTEHGLIVETLYGGYDGQPPAPEHPRLIAVGRRA